MATVVSIPVVLILLAASLSVALIVLAYVLGTYGKAHALVVAHRGWINTIEQHQHCIVTRPGNRSDRLAQYLALECVLTEMHVRLNTDSMLPEKGKVEGSTRSAARVVITCQGRVYR